MSNIQKEIGARLRSLREDRGLKQKDLSDVLGVTPAAYGKFESGDRGLSSENCIALADYFGVTCDYILRGVPSEHVDLYNQTCLSPKSIDVLVNQKKQLTECNQELKANEMNMQAITPLINNVVYSYILNAIIENHDLQNSLIWSGCKIITQTYEFAETAITELVDGETIFDFPEFDDYKTILAACRYTAGQAFSNFFDALCSNEEFMCCLKGYATNPQFDEVMQSEITKEILRVFRR